LKNAVLDSYAVLAFLFKEKGHEIVLGLLEKALENGIKLLIAAPNWAEVRYMVERKAGGHRWVEVKAKLRGLPIAIRDADLALAESAGEIKAFHRISLADCFSAALARREQAALYTGDPEFKSVETEQKIVWL
jgi:predicted nucleic acid-binding protein